MPFERDTGIIDLRPVPCLSEPQKISTAEVEYQNARNNYLGNESHCLYCLRQNSTPKVGLITLEHIVPKDARNRYPKSIGKIVDNDCNHLRICDETHRVIDTGTGRGHNRKWGKMYTLARYGMTGLVQFLGQYPRAIDKNFFDRQEKQFYDLFKVMDRQISRQLAISSMQSVPLGTNLFAYEGFPTDLDLALEYADVAKTIEDFTQAQDFVGFYLDQWKQGNFENQFLQAA